MALDQLDLDNLSTTRLGQPLFHVGEVDSTQDLLRELVRPNPVEGMAVLADHQRKGRGRQGRSWFALPEAQISLSILLRPPLSTAQLPILNIVAGLALAEAMELCSVSGVQLKWPNDLLISGKKVAGILSDLETVEGEAPCLLLGIGVNVTATIKQFPPELRETATALSLHGRVDRLLLLSHFFNRLEERYDELLTEGPETTRKAFAGYWVYRGQEIAVEQAQRTLRGLSEGIDTDGALLLRTEAEEVERIVAGDITPSSLVPCS